MGEYSTWVAAHEAKHKDEVERLNAQVAMLRESMEQLARLGNGDKYGNSIGNHIAQSSLAISESDWLATHDQQVRDKTLEEVAAHLAEGRLTESGMPLGIPARNIRAMKGRQ